MKELETESSALILEEASHGPHDYDHWRNSNNIAVRSG
jgi:hypothetical protein